MSRVDVLLGLQWGDEGKGKIVDFLAPRYEIVARFQGGPNAGHTLEFDGHKHVLHQIPSGIFREGILNVIGNGVVLDPITFQQEIRELEPFNIDLSRRLVVSNKAQLICPSHRLLDQAHEQAKGAAKIGSTLRGIGPTYEDKVGRVGLRVGDILEPDFQSKYKKLRQRHLIALENLNFDYSSLEENEEAFFRALDLLRSMNIVNTEYLLDQRLSAGDRVLAEGAQGSLLDIDFGSYPFVTSSNTISAGACVGLGISPKRIGEVYGIFKAYCTRVGSGPFPTELEDEAGDDLRQKGGEFGATTGRPRRCGWLDLPALKYACMLNGVTQLFMMKADVLAELDELFVGNAYKIDGREVNEVPMYFSDTIEPQFQSFPSWDDVKAKDFGSFPPALSNYIAHIQDFVGSPVNIVSVGPNRAETIIRESSDLFMEN